MPRTSTLPRVLLPFATLTLLMTGCSPVVDVEPAADAANPACAEVMVALPDEISDNELRQTDSQATAAWGEPSKLIVRCGVTPPGPTTDRCVTVNGIDWVLTEGDPAWTATTYGRDPAVEAVFDPNEVPSSTVLVSLGGAVDAVPQDNECLSVTKDQTIPEG